MKRKLLAVLLATTMVIGLVGCGAKKDDKKADTNAGSGSSLIKVGIINNDPAESGYRSANVADMERVFCKDNGYDAKTFYSLKNDEQIAQAQQMIQDGIQYLLLSAADTSGWDTVLKDAEAAGTKVILFDRTIDADENLYVSSVVSDMAKEGETAVEWLASLGLSEYKVVHIQGAMGSAAQIGRSGALDTKAAAEGNWDIVKQQTATWDEDQARTIVEEVIASKTDFNVIYAENDGMARGAVKALDNAGISHGVDGDVVVMGFDCNKWALESLLKGEWNYDGQCNPFQADTIDGIIKQLEKGETPEKVIILEEKGFSADTIKQEDVDQYGI